MDDYLLRPIAKLREEGWSDRRLRAAIANGELARPVRSIYGEPRELSGKDAHLARARGILMRQGTSVALSHVTAAIVHGLSVSDNDPGDVHLTVPPPARGRKRSGYHVHVAPLTEEDVTEVGGVRVTSLARTAADLARGVQFAWGVIAMDHALRRGVTRTELDRLVEAAARRSGVETLRRVVAFADGRSQSAAESASRVTMDRAGLPAPTLQFRVSNPSGWIADCDFGWPDRGVVGEVDGEGKYDERVARGSSAGKVVREQQDRDELIRQCGWWPTHWGWALAWDVQGLGDRIRGAFEAARGSIH